MLSKFVVIAGVILTIVVLFLDNFEEGSLGLLQLIIIDFLTIGIVYFLTRKKTKVCWSSILIAIAIVHILLLNNASGWNEGSGSGTSYIIPFLKNATDTLYALILFSAFLLLIPLTIYGFFIISLINLFCKNSTVTKNNDEFKQRTQDLFQDN
ncbi:MAG: hypothetical protein JXQ68_06815 [Campylobacterales bacterium]|nr:hypothetical protein [Campylobacterales bacterium]